MIFCSFALRDFVLVSGVQLPSTSDYFLALLLFVFKPFYFSFIIGSSSVVMNLCRRNVLCNLEFLLGRAVRDVRLVSFMWVCHSLSLLGLSCIQNFNLCVYLSC